MNGKRAKALRRALLTGETRYVEGRKGKTIAMKGGEPVEVEITGTVRAEGARRQYQAVKRNPKLRAVLLGVK